MWAWAGGQNECDALIEETALGQSRVLDGRRGRQVSVGGVIGENLCEKKTKRQEKQRRGEQ